MRYKILADSSCDVDDRMKGELEITLVPLTIDVDGTRYVDDGELDVASYIRIMNASSNNPKSACPSPEDYLKEIPEDAEGTFIITLSSALSGSFNSAMLARNLYLEGNPEKKVHVFDSRSAASGEVLAALWTAECIRQGMGFEEIVDVVEERIRNMTVVFVLERLDHLEKAGRLSTLKAAIANVLNIKLILHATREGTIDLLGKARGTGKALGKMVETIGGKGEDLSGKTLVIAHCAARDRAEQVKGMVEARYGFKEILIVPTRGLSSTYANEGGVILAY
ncbi:DegV family protein [Anaerotalea alkaliphila]|uniref:DegV family protein n=1 Tax=Anaerotalea alkaliphila TaxID=2662126 RepID=A0A7X5HU32_9FIRM|nr:DegV family protein [Anaerotalea alkaliphila]NDL66675.1 DegV family protein [Anaerotalea alkaliphila]